MELSQQVVSLEIARRLKELGVPQKSLFYWARSGEHFCQTDKVEAGEASIVSEKPPYDFPFECLGSAFSCSELGEILPKGIEHSGKQMSLHIRKFLERWQVNYRSTVSSDNAIVFDATTEADARGAMLIHLIEVGIVKV